MHITKFGHCCLLIELNGIRILTDPGAYSTKQNEAVNIDAILITHEHQDHLHIESLKTVLKNNPQAGVITNTGVGTLLKKKTFLSRSSNMGKAPLSKASVSRDSVQRMQTSIKPLPQSTTQDTSLPTSSSIQEMHSHIQTNR